MQLVRLKPRCEGKEQEVSECRAPRLYVIARLAPGEAVELSTGQAHYLRSVLRLGAGAAVTAFNASDGEWLCRIAEIGKRGAQLMIDRRMRSPTREPDLWLLFAPIKRARLDWLVEKATELGASALLPVWTARTQAERFNRERLRALAIAPAEQSERPSGPGVHAPERLAQLVSGAAAPLR